MPHLLEGIVLHAGRILLVVLILIAGLDLLEGFFSHVCLQDSIC